MFCQGQQRWMRAALSAATKWRQIRKYFERFELVPLAASVLPAITVDTRHGLGHVQSRHPASSATPALPLLSLALITAFPVGHTRDAAVPVCALIHEARVCAVAGEKRWTRAAISTTTKCERIQKILREANMKHGSARPGVIRSRMGRHGIGMCRSAARHALLAGV